MPVRDMRPILSWHLSVPGHSGPPYPAPVEEIERWVKLPFAWPNPRTVFHMPASWLPGGVHNMPSAQWHTLDSARRKAWIAAAGRVREAGGTVGVYIGARGLSAFTRHTLWQGAHRINHWALLHTIRAMESALAPGPAALEVWLDGVDWPDYYTLQLCAEIAYRHRGARVAIEGCWPGEPTLNIAPVPMTAMVYPQVKPESEGITRHLWNLHHGDDPSGWPPAPDGCEQVLHWVWRDYPDGRNPINSGAVRDQITAEIRAAKQLGYCIAVNFTLAALPEIKEAVLE